MKPEIAELALQAIITILPTTLIAGFLIFESQRQRKLIGMKGFEHLDILVMLMGIHREIAAAVDSVYGCCCDVDRILRCGVYLGNYLCHTFRSSSPNVAILWEYAALH